MCFKRILVYFLIEVHIPLQKTDSKLQSVQNFIDIFVISTLNVLQIAGTFFDQYTERFPIVFRIVLVFN